jgi:hypothetical protein
MKTKLLIFVKKNWLFSLLQITFAEIFLGISYLPTAERFTIKLNKLRYICKIEKEEKIGKKLDKENN